MLKKKLHLRYVKIKLYFLSTLYISISKNTLQNKKENITYILNFHDLQEKRNVFGMSTLAMNGHAG